MTTSVLDEHRDDGPLATVVRALPTTSTPWAVALWPVVGAVALAAALGARGAVVALGLAGVVLGLVASGGHASARFGWLTPPSLRLLEYGCLVVVARMDAHPGAMPAAVALLLAVVGHHYEALYRVANRGVGPSRAVRWALGGWEGRTLVVLVASVAGVVVPVVWCLAVWCGGLALIESAWAWRSATPSDHRDP